MFDVHLRMNRDDQTTVWVMRAGLDDIGRLFSLHDSAIRRVQEAAHDGEQIELFCNGRAHGAWGLLGRAGHLPHSVTLWPQPKPAPAKTTGRTVWVAVSMWYDDSDGLEPLSVVGDTREAADAALEDLMQAEYSAGHGDDQTFAEWRELWIDNPTVELPVHSLRD